MSQYFKCKWIHSNPEDPTLLYSELDDTRMETRKIEIWSDNQIGFADQREHSAKTELGKVAVPELSDIAKDPQFQPIKISKNEFEEVWAKRKG